MRGPVYYVSFLYSFFPKLLPATECVFAVRDRQDGHPFAAITCLMTHPTKLKVDATGHGPPLPMGEYIDHLHGEKSFSISSLGLLSDLNSWSVVCCSFSIAATALHIFNVNDNDRT